MGGWRVSNTSLSALGHISGDNRPCKAVMTILSGLNRRTRKSKMEEKEKVDAAVSTLKEAGHSVEAQVRDEKGEMWFNVDNRMLVSWEEMQELADSLDAVEELEDLYKKRQAEKART
jgi:hypothetical protein